MRGGGVGGLYAGGELELHLKKWAGIDYAVENYPVDVPLAGCAEWSAAGRRWRIKHVPGHSPDSLVFIEEAAARVFSGDTLMKEGVGRSDFPDGDGALLLRGIQEKIMVLPDAFSVLSGHGPATTVGAERRSNPFLEG